MLMARFDQSPTKANMAGRSNRITLEDGTVIIPASKRPDGTMRKERRIKPGYTPPDEKVVRKYRPPAIRRRENKNIQRQATPSTSSASIIKTSKSKLDGNDTKSKTSNLSFCSSNAKSKLTTKNNISRVGVQTGAIKYNCSRINDNSKSISNTIGKTFHKGSSSTANCSVIIPSNPLEDTCSENITTSSTSIFNEIPSIPIIKLLHTEQPTLKSKCKSDFDEDTVGSSVKLVEVVSQHASLVPKTSDVGDIETIDAKLKSCGISSELSFEKQAALLGQELESVSVALEKSSNIPIDVAGTHSSSIMFEQNPENLLIKKERLEIELNEIVERIDLIKLL